MRDDTSLYCISYAWRKTQQGFLILWESFTCKIGSQTVWNPWKLYSGYSMWQTLRSDRGSLAWGTKLYATTSREISKWENQAWYMNRGASGSCRKGWLLIRSSRTCPWKKQPALVIFHKKAKVGAIYGSSGFLIVGSDYSETPSWPKLRHSELRLVHRPPVYNQSFMELYS